MPLLFTFLALFFAYPWFRSFYGVMDALNSSDRSTMEPWSKCEKPFLVVSSLISLVFIVILPVLLAFLLLWCAISIPWKLMARILQISDEEQPILPRLRQNNGITLREGLKNGWS